jgi:hypothetical protein
MTQAICEGLVCLQEMPGIARVFQGFHIMPGHKDESASPSTLVGALLHQR